MEKQTEIAKALQDIANAVNNNEAVESIKVVITIKKQKPSKAKEESR